jgi:hypothetical protein
MSSTTSISGGGGTGGSSGDDGGGGLETPPKVNALPSQPQTPPGTKRVVIWDTNACRNFVGGDSVADARAKALLLRQREQSAGVFSLASPIVIWELAAHVADSTDPHYSVCLAALTALAEQTWARNDPPGGVCVFADPASLICRELFHAVPPLAQKNVQHISLLAAHAKLHAPDMSDTVAQQNFKSFSIAMENEENKWIQDMLGVINECSPEIAKKWIGGVDGKDTQAKLRKYFGSEQFMAAWAGVTVMKHAALVNAKLSPEDFKQKVNAVRDIFPTPFRLMSTLLQKFPLPNPIKIDHPKKKRGNYVWDCAVCFSIGAKHEIGDAKMYLVTADKNIIDAAKDAGCSDRVLSLADYLKSVGFP